MYPPPCPWIARVTSSTYSKGGTKLLKGGTKLLKGGTKLLKGGTKLLKGGTKLLKGGTKLLKGGTKSLGWATGGGRTTPPTPPWLRAWCNKLLYPLHNSAKENVWIGYKKKTVADSGWVWGLKPPRRFFVNCLSV